LKFRTRLPLVLLFAVSVALLAASARAASPTSAPQPSESVHPQGGNDTVKLASLGVVFLIIGAAVVYAPQIVSAITGMPRRMSRKQRRAPAPRRSEPTISREPAVTEAPVIEVHQPPRQSTPSAPERLIAIPESHDVVTRLQNEVRSAWSKTR
jgi:hypothetical protein